MAMLSFLSASFAKRRKRIDRMSHKYRDAGHDTVREFMKRDEAAAESYGQQ